MTPFPENWPRVRAALCHDWLTGMRGGERVLEILCEGFPEAPIYTLIANRDSISDTIRSHRIETSWMQRIPNIANRYRACLPLFPAAIRNLHPGADIELMVSTSSCVAKSIRTHPGTRHLCYCFTPMRYAWTFYEEYFGTSRAKALLAKPLLAALRQWDRETAARVDRFVAISNHVQKRIKDFYGRDADVVYPPVDTRRCTPGGTPASADFDLIVSAMVPYKRIDLAVAAYTRLGYPLKIVGIGSKLPELQAVAGRNIAFLGWQSDEAILALYRNCRLLVFPGEEDFGIVPLEAQSCGRPVVAYGRGGALETVQDGVSGLFFDEQTQESLLNAIEACAAREWDPQAIRQHAERFSVANFVEGLASRIQRCLA